MLKKRIMTAIVLIPIIVIVILLRDSKWFALLFAVIVAIGAWEWGALCKLSEKQCYCYSMITILILFGLYWTESRYLYNSVILCGAIYWIVATLLVFLYQNQRNLLPRSVLILLVIGLLLLVPMWSSLTALKVFSKNGVSLLLFLLLLIWSADTAAYFIGKKWGRRRLASRVSPGKTWEGTIAGIVAGVLVSLCYVTFSSMALNNVAIFVSLSALIVFISVIGDLMESLIKREAGLKDSGTILPGHGGVMDRIDSLTAAGPVFVTSLLYLGMFG